MIAPAVSRGEKLGPGGGNSPPEASVEKSLGALLSPPADKALIALNELNKFFINYSYSMFFECGLIFILL